MRFTRGNFLRIQKLALTTQVRKLYPDMTRGRQSACAAIIQKMINGERVYRGPGYQDECDSDVVAALVNQHRIELEMSEDDIPASSDAAAKVRKRAAKQKLKKGKAKKSDSSESSAITLTDSFIRRNTWMILAYYCHCLQIQEEGLGQVPEDLGDGGARESEEDVRLFNIFPLPNDHGQHKHATIGNQFFYHILKQHGDEEDLVALKGYNANTFVNHPSLDDFWSKYFSFGKFETNATSRLFQMLIDDGDLDDYDLLRIGQDDEYDVVRFYDHPRLEHFKQKYASFYERASQEVSRKFHRLLTTDGVTVSFAFKSTYHKNSGHAGVQCFPEPRVPDVVTDECNRPVSFGKYANFTFRDLVELNPSMGESGKSYIADYCFEQSRKRSCSQALLDFVSYASGEMFREPPDLPDESDIRELTDAELEKLDLEEILPWWGDDVTEVDPDKIILRTTKGEMLTVSQVRGKQCAALY